MQVHELQRNKSHKTKKRIGRGGKRGTYSGKGLKGQKSRAGKKMRPEMRDIIKKIPKKRGYRFSSIQTKPIIVNIALLDKLFFDGERVTPKILIARWNSGKGKKRPLRVKVLGNGEIKKKIIISQCAISKNAQTKIEGAGGKIE